MGILETLFGVNKQNGKQMKPKAQIKKEKQELERKLWELAEEYEEED